MAKSEQPFDKIIKEKLDAFSPQDIPDWHFMQQKIHDAESDLLIDHKIKQVFDDLKIDAPQIQWDSFLAKRNRQIARRNKIISARVIESCLVLLLLWTIDNIGITHIIKPVKQIDASQIAQVDNTILKPESETGRTSTRTNGYNQNEIGLITITNEPKEKGFNRKKINASHSLDETKLHKKLIKPPFINPISNRIIIAETTDNNNLISNPTHSAIPSESIHLIEQAKETGIQQILPSSNNEDKIFLEENSISPLEQKIDELPIEKLIIDLDHKLPKTIATLKPQVLQKFVALNVHSGLMMNVVLSPPFTETSSTKLYSQLRPGFQTAISIGFQTKKYLLESGLVYQNIKYEPNQNEKIYITQVDPLTNEIKTIGSYWLHFDKTKIQIISIPVLIHAKIMEGNSWFISSKIGLSLSAALKNDFIIDTFGTVLYPKENQGIWNNSNTKFEEDSKISARVKNTSNLGILDGGDFGVNSYANLVAGIRYQRRLNQNLSFYTEFEISKMIGTIGFGPNGDRFISGNLNTGISVRL